ncbi:unnamed protein product [Owenia fusiformis]|uniref:Uncharacterized protein n=1 Tax=Owenia fusiformis TaxID=6347 RepID=A0A8S4Q9Z5_OWEFU|nr:unnamed protein product [Owenia fusiformis]
MIFKFVGNWLKRTWGRGRLFFPRMSWEKLQAFIITVLCLLQCGKCTAECGENPLSTVMALAKGTGLFKAKGASTMLNGRSVRLLLNVLKQVDKGAYHALEKNFKRYAACNGVGDTGMWKRSQRTDDINIPTPEKIVLSDLNDIFKQYDTRAVSDFSIDPSAVTKSLSRDSSIWKVILNYLQNKKSQNSFKNALLKRQGMKDESLPLKRIQWLDAESY